MATVGVDIGGSQIVTIVLSEDDEIVGEARMRRPPSGDPAATVEIIAAAVHEAADRASMSAGEADAIGVGSPGVVVDGTVGQAVNVPGWSERFRLAELLSQRVPAPIRVVNDATGRAVGEHRLGAGVGCDQLLVVHIGTGVGSGVVLNGRLYQGAYGAAGEFGHTIVERGGAVCPCGRRGCVEAYAGRHAMENAARRALDAGKSTSLFRIAEELGVDRLTDAVFRTALEIGDPLAADLVDWGAEALGKGIASAVNLLDVERVVIGGGFADALGTQFIVRAEAAALPALFFQPPRVEIVAGRLGEVGAALGAALVARDALSEGRA